MMPSANDNTERQFRRQGFLDAMAQAASSVSIVATDGQAGRDGVIVSALTSVSADTPLPTLLVCLHQAGRVPAKLLSNGVFSVNLLADDHHDLAQRFAGRSTLPREDWFGPEWTGSRVPVLATALASFDCVVHASQLVGTHHVIFGAVRAVAIRPSGHPLIHAQRQFHRLGGLSSPKPTQD